MIHHFPQSHDFLLCLDSDGCVFDSMELKQRECIIPTLIEHWDLAGAREQTARTAAFVNLYSRSRGANRWPALIRVLDLLAEWDEVRIPVPRAEAVREWIAREPRLSNETLRAAVEAGGDPELARALAWTEEVNRRIETATLGIQPFPGVREVLADVSRWADVLVCSTTAQAALEREWRDAGIAPYVTVIAGQEFGAKAAQIAQVAEGRYAKERILMVGDAPGDLAAARANGAHFYPIRPGQEVESWQGFPLGIREGSYSEEEERRQEEAFLALLPEAPPWKLR